MVLAVQGLIVNDSARKDLNWVSSSSRPRLTVDAVLGQQPGTNSL
jgi:hypothetical protein